MPEPQQFQLQKWFSVGDVITLVVMLLALGVTFGSLSKDVDILKNDIAEMKERRISPGAETALASIQAKDEAQDQQIAALRDELRYQRREILDAINKLESELQARR